MGLDENFYADQEVVIEASLRDWLVSCFESLQVAWRAQSLEEIVHGKGRTVSAPRP